MGRNYLIIEASPRKCASAPQRVSELGAKTAWLEIRVALAFVAASLGSAYLWSGRADEAVLLLEEAVEAFTATRMLGFRSLFPPVPGRGPSSRQGLNANTEGHTVDHCHDARGSSEHMESFRPMSPGG